MYTRYDIGTHNNRMDLTNSKAVHTKITKRGHVNIISSTKAFIGNYSANITSIHVGTADEPKHH